MVRRLILIGLTCAVTAAPAWAQDRKQKVLDDQKAFSADSGWIYNDLDQAFREARRTGKPLLVVLRCIP